MGLKLNGATSGSIEIDVPAVAGTDTAITIPATSGGEFIVSDSSGNIDLGPLDINGGAADDSVNIDGSGRLLVGTSSSTSVGGFGEALIQAKGNFTRSITLINDTNDTNYSGLSICKRATGGSLSSGYAMGGLLFQGYDGANYLIGARIEGYIDGGVSTNDLPSRLVFSTTQDGASSPTERMRITSTGILSNKGNDPNNIGNLAGAGWALSPNGDGYFVITRDGSNPVYINRLSADGDLIIFYQDGTGEGSISVSGTTVSYNGAHLSRWSQLPGGVERTEILRGSVLSNIDEMCEWSYEAEPEVLWAEGDELPEGVSVGDVKTPAKAAGTEDNEQLNRMKVSDVEGDKNVAGVFQGWDDEDDTYTNDFYCAMTGDFVIRIAQGVTVERGDLLMSAGDGTAKPQGDDIVRSKTIAKVTSTNVSCTYDDGSYCVPCVLMAC